MADIDDETLAYAMAMGVDFRVRETLVRSAKKPKVREIALQVTTDDMDRQVDRSGYMTHLIARLMSERIVAIQPGSRGKATVEWIVCDEGAGSRSASRLRP